MKSLATEDVNPVPLCFLSSSWLTLGTDWDQSLSTEPSFTTSVTSLSLKWNKCALFSSFVLQSILHCNTSFLSQNNKVRLICWCHPRLQASMLMMEHSFLCSHHFIMNFFHQHHASLTCANEKLRNKNHVYVYLSVNTSCRTLTYLSDFLRH